MLGTGTLWVGFIGALKLFFNMLLLVDSVVSVVLPEWVFDLLVGLTRRQPTDACRVREPGLVVLCNVDIGIFPVGSFCCTAADDDIVSVWKPSY